MKGRQVFLSVARAWVLIAVAAVLSLPPLGVAGQTAQGTPTQGAPGVITVR